MKTRYVSIIAAVIMVALVSGNAFAWGGSCDAKKCGPRESAKVTIAKELNLTPEQEKSLEAVRTTGRKEMDEMQSAIKDKKLALRAALAKPGVTKKDVEQIAGELKALESVMVDKRIDGIFKIKEILTPEQFTRLQEMKKGHEKNYKDKNGRKGR